MPTISDVTPLVWLAVALVAAATIVALFIRVEPSGEEPQRPPLLTQEYAPGETVEQPTPYYVAPVPESPDPLEVAANTDRKALLATALLFGVFAMMGAYYTLQTGIPVRLPFVYGGTTMLDAAKEKQLDASVERGAKIYASLCFDCHGKRGQGDVGVGLPLNKADFRASCGPNGEDANGKKCKVADDDKIRDFISKTVARGRQRPPPGFSMPAWARDEGGQLNQEQLNQVVSFIMYGNWDRILQIREEENLALEPNPPRPPVPQSPEDLGKQVANQPTTCLACHSFTPGTNSPNPQAPNLGHYATEGPFTDQVKALKASGDPNWLKKWVTNAPSIKPGTAMPKWQGILTEQQIEAVVAYLFSLK